MALQKQLVHLNLTGGLQKKDDDFVVIPTKLAVADNVEFDDASTVVRRGGQERLSLTALNSGTGVDTSYRAFPHKGSVVIEAKSGNHKVWGDGGSTILVPTKHEVYSPYHHIRAGMTTARVGAVDRKGTTYGASIPTSDGAVDCAVMGDLTCYVWESRDVSGNGRQAMRVEVIDESTGFRLYSKLVAAVAANHIVKPRVVAITALNKFFIYYADFVSGGGVYSRGDRNYAGR